jgi:hypothetical protein
MIKPSSAINPTSAIRERTPDGVSTVRAVPSATADKVTASQRFRACVIDDLPARGRHPRPFGVAAS